MSVKTNNPKSNIPSEDDGIKIGTINLAPRLSSAQYMNIVDASFETMSKEYGPKWTNQKTYGATVSKIALENMVNCRRQFIMHWYDLLSADLEIIEIGEEMGVSL